MAAREGRLHINNFSVDLGVTQEAPMTPIIFNVVVDVVVHHRLTQLCGRQTVEKGIGTHIDQESALLYSYYVWL